MKFNLRRCVASVAIAAVMISAMAANASAAVITSMAGAYLSAPQIGPGNASFTLLGGVFGNSLPTDVGPGGVVGNLGVDLALFTSNPGPVTLTGFTVQLGAGGPIATFSPFGVATQTIDNGPGINAGTISSVFQLVGLSSGLHDLGLIGGLWDYKLTHNGLDVNEGPGGGTAVVVSATTASFTLQQQAPPPVPEPASIAVWSVLAMAGYGARRKLARAKA